MNNKVKYYLNGHKRKEVLDMVKNGFDFKLIINYAPEGNISSAMEKPDLKRLAPNILASGAHVFMNPNFNHCDFFLSGVPVFKEYPENKTNYGYEISGSCLIV